TSIILIKLIRVSLGTVRHPRRFKIVVIDIQITLKQMLRDFIGIDRKSGSAGMPRPISYAVFCLKQKIEKERRQLHQFSPYCLRRLNASLSYSSFSFRFARDLPSFPTRRSSDLNEHHLD